MKIKLTAVQYGKHKIGSTITVTKKEGDYLILSKVATLVIEKEPKKDGK